MWKRGEGADAVGWAKSRSEAFPRGENPVLALRVLDHDARIAGAGLRCTNRTNRLDEPVRHGSTGCAGPPLRKMTAVGLWPGEDTQFDRLLAAIGLRQPAGTDV